MKGPCESNCGALVQVSGCKWCPECYPKFSMSSSLRQKAFVVIAGKFETTEDEDGHPELSENIKFCSAPMLIEEAERTLEEYKGYPFARIEHVEVDK